ncbi:MAG: hypothetical protein EPO57_00400 [Chitinophagaceae bacterium]|nr:MAG: hypothetical protein EPO57_00400 [Chitinophagaceae bacterium]
MVTQFERTKNTKALLITLFATLLLFLSFIYLKWPLPEIEVFAQNDFIEVNLGNDELGFGNDQPQIPSEPSEQNFNTNAAPIAIEKDEAKKFETDDKEAPVIKKPVATKPVASKINKDNKTIKVKNKPVATLAAPKPKAVLGKITGDNGNGGNGATTYEKGSNEGMTSGTGDQGVIGGTPGATNYSGPRKNFGTKFLQIADQSFEDEFNENAKIAVDIIAEPSGRVVSATYQARGSTTGNRKLIEIARRRAFELKLEKSESGQKGTVVFNFKLKD